MERQYQLAEMLMIGVLAAVLGGTAGTIIARDYDGRAMREHEATYHAPTTRGGVEMDPSPPCEIGSIMDTNQEGTVIYVVTCEAP